MKQLSGTIEISGRAGSGKTALTIAAAQSVLQEGKKVLYLDGDGTLRDTPESQLFSYYVCPKNTDTVTEVVMAHHLADPKLGLIIVDGYSSLTWDLQVALRKQVNDRKIGFSLSRGQCEGKKMREAEPHTFVPIRISVTTIVDVPYSPEVGDSYRRPTDSPGQSCVRVNSVRPGRDVLLGDPPKHKWYTVDLRLEPFVRIEDLRSLVPTCQRRKTDLYQGMLEVRPDGRMQGFGSTSIGGTDLSWVMREYRPVEVLARQPSLAQFDLFDRDQEQCIFRMEIGPHVPAENDFYETLYEAKLYEYPWEVRTSHGYS